MQQSYEDRVVAILKPIETVPHTFALKRFLGVPQQTPNPIVYGETPRYPLHGTVFVKGIKYWLHIF